VEVHEGGARDVEEENDPAEVPEGDVGLLGDWEGSPDLQQLSSDARWVQHHEERVAQEEERIWHGLHEEVDGVEEVARDFNESPAASHQVERPMGLAHGEAAAVQPEEAKTRRNLSRTMNNLDVFVVA